MPGVISLILPPKNFLSRSASSGEQTTPSAPLSSPSAASCLTVLSMPQRKPERKSPYSSKLVSTVMPQSLGLFSNSAQAFTMSAPPERCSETE